MAEVSELTVRSPKQTDSKTSDKTQSQSYIEPTEDPYTKSICYLERHNIVELFQNLTSGVVYNRPSDPLDFLIQEVQQLKQQRDQETK
ncbi:hypothetical protein BsWGS_14658 [Bradybaena similaris]